MYIKGQHGTTAVSEYLAGLQNLSESSKIAHHSCRCEEAIVAAIPREHGLFLPESVGVRVTLIAFFDCL